MKRWRRAVVSLALMLIAAAASAQAATDIRLATIDPGEIYWQRFGHNALVIGLAERNEAVSYNFGYFDFEQPDFFTRFLRGRMLYQALALPASDDLDRYVDERRSVHLQTLVLSPEQADRLHAQLREAVAPENRDYLYEYFRANCSTRIRDAIDTALEGQLKRQTLGRSRGFTYRMHAMRLAQGDFWLATGIDLGLGPDTDRALSFWDEMFVPEMLRRYLREVRTAEGVPLVGDETTWFGSDDAPPPELPKDRRVGFALAGLVIAIALFWLGECARRSAGARRAMTAIAATLHLLFGLAGAILLFLWLGTDHIAAHRNENLLLLSPLSLLLAPLWLRRTRRDHRTILDRTGTALAALVAISAVIGLFAKALPDTFPQANLHWCLLLVPIHLALFAGWRTSRRCRTS